MFAKLDLHWPVVVTPLYSWLSFLNLNTLVASQECSDLSFTFEQRWYVVWSVAVHTPEPCVDDTAASPFCFGTPGTLCRRCRC